MGKKTDQTPGNTWVEVRQGENALFLRSASLKKLAPRIRFPEFFHSCRTRIVPALRSAPSPDLLLVVQIFFSDAG
jgi:hypothetical protein